MSRIEELTLKLLDGEIDDAEASELDGLLADDPSARNQHVALCDVEAALRGQRTDLDVRQGVMQRIRRAAEDESESADSAEDSPAMARSGRSRSQDEADVPVAGRTAHAGRGRRRTLAWSIAVAAVLLLGVGIGYWLVSAPGTSDGLLPALAATIIRADLGTTVERKGQSIAAEADLKLEPGDVLHTADSATSFRYEDGTLVEVSRQARVVFQPERDSESPSRDLFLRLENGTAVAEVTKQPAGRNFVFRTPNAKVRVIGTRFTTTATSVSTRVQVAKGRVELTRDSDGKSVIIAAGQYAVAAANTELVALPVSRTRVANPLVLYRFDEGSGTVVHDVSEFGEPVDLTVRDPNRVRWLSDGGLALTEPTLLSSDVPARKICEACRDAGEITVEAWITPALAEQHGPARIVSVSANHTLRNFTLGHGRDADENLAVDTYLGRVRTTETSENGLPSTETPEATAVAEKTHLVFPHTAAGQSRIYVDGVCRAEREIGGDFSGWAPDYQLLLGNELIGVRAWLGAYHLVAIYGRALDEAQVQQNFSVGPPR